MCFIFNKFRKRLEDLISFLNITLDNRNWVYYAPEVTLDQLEKLERELATIIDQMKEQLRDL